MLRQFVIGELEAEFQFDAEGNPVAVALYGVLRRRPRPQAATNLRLAAVSDTEVELAWDDQNDATSWAVFRAEDGGEFAEIDTSALPSFTDSNVETETSYVYKIEAINTGGRAQVFSNELPVQTNPATGNVPDAPTGLATSLNTARQVRLTWTNPGDVLDWDVYRDDVLIGEGVTVTEFLDASVEPETSYDYTVTARNAEGDSDPSAAFEVTTPTNTAPLWSIDGPELEIFVGEAYFLDLNLICTDPDGHPLSYSLESGSLPTGLLFDGTLGRITGITAVTPAAFLIVVRAYDGFDTTDQAITLVVADPDVTAPSVPGNVDSTISGNQITVTWDASTDAENEIAHYNVWRSTTGLGGTYSLRTTTDDLSFVDLGLGDGTYHYKISAVDTSHNANESARSSAVSETVSNPLPPSVPINVSAQGTSLTNIRVTWDPGPGGPTPQQYKVYRSNTQDGTYSLRSTVNAPAEILDDTVTSGVTRWYKVSAVTNGIESAQSSPSVPGTGENPNPGPGTMFFSDGFESGTILPASAASGWSHNSTSGAMRTVMSAGGGYNGSTYFVRHRLVAAAGNFRNESLCRSNGSAAAQHYAHLVETNTPVYFGFAVRLLVGHVNDDLTGDTLCQIHMGQLAAPNQADHAGHYAIAVNNDQWRFEVNRGEGGVPPLGGGNVGLGGLNSDKGVWKRWLIEMVFRSSGGSIRVWANPGSISDTPLYSESGIRTYQPLGVIPNFRIGLYKSQWRSGAFSNNYDAGESPNVSPRDFDHDDIRIADAFDLVK